MLNKIRRIVGSYIPAYIKYGRLYRSKIKFLRASKDWDHKKKMEYQLNELNKLLLHSYNTVPYYRRAFNECNIKLPLENLEDIKLIPVLTKKDVQKNYKELLSEEYSVERIKHFTTGGSTGEPLKLSCSWEAWKNELAFTHFIWEQAGYDIKRTKRIAVLRGERPECGLYSKYGKVMIMSAYLLTKDNYSKYIQLLEEFNPAYIHCFPSAIILLSKLIGENHKPNIPNLKCIFTSSESFSYEDKELVSKVFGVSICDLYGLSESSIIGYSLNLEPKYNFLFQYGIIEQNLNGEMIGTGFGNYAMPLIRYNTSDQCDYSNEDFIQSTTKIHGRSKDFLIGKDSSFISISATNFHDDTFEGVVSFQYVQSSPGVTELHVVLDCEVDLNRLKHRLEKILSNNIEVVVKRVDYINKTRSGKQLILKQNLNIDEYR